MTIDTSREAVELRLTRLRAAYEEFRAPYGHIAALITQAKLTETMMDALLAERDAALAEVARLSHALAADTAKREAMEAAIEVKGGNEHAPTQWAYDRACDALRATKTDRDAERKLADDLAEALQYADTFIRQELGGLRNPHRTSVLAAHAARRNEETLAKHGSK